MKKVNGLAITLIIVVAIWIIVAWAPPFENGEEVTGTETTTEIPKVEVTTTPEVAPTPEPETTPQVIVKEFNIVAKRWDFDPEIIIVDLGDTVMMHVESIDVSHGFSLSSFGVNERLNPGQTTDIEFVADKKGSFTFFCNVFCGSGHGGMRGKLIVE